jgi:hypothetical protein
LPWARRLLEELAARDPSTTVHSYSMGKKEFLCELCGTANWRPVLGKDHEPVGNLVTCADCRAVYELPRERPPMGLRGEPGTPDLKTYGPTPRR